MAIKSEFRIPASVLQSVAETKGLWHGGTTNVNHEDCPAGTDRRARLYVTMDNNGTLLGYCHNCGSRGVMFSTGVSNIHNRIVHPKDSKHFDPPPIWLSSHEIPALIPLVIKEYKAFFTQWGISQEWACKDGWRYDYDGTVSCMVLLFPSYNKDGELCGVQRRHLLTKEELERRMLPKIMTFGTMTPHLFNPNDSETCVIVEDRVSLVRVVDAGYAGLCMHGCKMLKATEAAQLSTLFPRVVLWYDNDNDAVEQIAQDSFKVLSMFTSDCAIVHTIKEPKHFTREQISELIGVRS